MLRRPAIRLRAPLLVPCLLLTMACGEPPRREMDQAQGAIDAARAAGADRFAAEQYTAAVQALASAEEAVAQRDFRLALNYALDARDRAQSAAKEAAGRQAVLRSAAERRLGEVTASLDQARRRLKAAEASRAARTALAGARGAIARAEDSLQEAGTNIQEGNYDESQAQLAESAKDLERAVAEIDTAARGRGGRRR